MLIRLRGCAGLSAPLLFAYGINRFSHDVAQSLNCPQQSNRNEHQNYANRNDPRFSAKQAWANSADPDQMLGAGPTLFAIASATS